MASITPRGTTVWSMPFSTITGSRASMGFVACPCRHSYNEPTSSATEIGMKKAGARTHPTPAFEFDSPLFGIQNARNKTGPMLRVTRVPNHDDLVYSDVAHFVVAIFEVQHATFDLDNLST